MSDLAAGPRRARSAIEWPTIALAIVIYGGWGLITAFHASLPLWLLVPLGAWFTAWHGSFQHEIVHGHPTRSRPFNRLIGMWPLMLWVPFEAYRVDHLTHHRDERLTDPFDDPESNYRAPEQWAAIGPLRRAIIRVNGTFLGRITIGPLWVAANYLWSDVKLMLGGDRLRRRIWLEHIPALAVVLAWLVVVCGMNPLFYLVAIAWPATSLMLIRSYAEHRAESAVEERTAIVENAPVMGLLFLYNNLHVVHHEQPMMPWYEIPAYYRANREALIRRNNGLVYNSYVDVARRYLLSPHDGPVHPLGRIPKVA